MKITINLSEDLILQAKKAALETGTTLSDIISNALLEALTMRQRETSRKEFRLITHGKGGVQPGVDLEDTSALLDLMDGIDDPHQP
jgi:hypothetical protein